MEFSKAPKKKWIKVGPNNWLIKTEDDCAYYISKHRLKGKVFVIQFSPTPKIRESFEFIGDKKSLIYAQTFVMNHNEKRTSK